MPLAGFETATPASDRPLTLALNRATTGMGIYLNSEEHWYRAISEFSRIWASTEEGGRLRL